MRFRTSVVAAILATLGAQAGTGDSGGADPADRLDAGVSSGKPGDVFYPPEEASELAGLEIPRAVAFDGRQATFRNRAGETQAVAFGSKAWGWEFLTTATAGGRTAAVLDRRFAHWGLIAWVDEHGEVARVRTAVGDLGSVRRGASRYEADLEERILASDTDLLGDRVLARDEDPSFEACAAFLPDLNAYTFLSGEFSDDVLAVAPDGRLGPMRGAYGPDRLEKTLFNPMDHLPPHKPTASKRSLLGGHLPAVDYAFRDEESGVTWELAAFGRPRRGQPLQHALTPKREILPERLDALISLRTSSAAAPNASPARKYFRAGEGLEEISAAEFFTELFEFRALWEAVFSEAMAVEIPDRRLVDAATASLARAIVTYNGLAPRYGVGVYHAKAHGTFPPATLSMVNACIEWNLPGRARAYLDYYLDYVTLPDGTFNYYGPAVSEYGQMLDLIARYARRSGDAAWLRARAAKIDAIANRLLALRRASLEENPEGDPRHGLVPGSPEADNREDQNYYFSGDAWIWRGWTEIGRVYGEMGNDAMRARGRRLLAECDAYRADIEAGIEKSMLEAGGEPFLPPIAGQEKPFLQMTESRLAMYTNYRYWLEMLSSGLLRPEWADAIIAYRRQHGGEALGTTRFRDHLDDWPYAGYAYGLLLRDRVPHYLLGLYGDLALHRMHGTFTAYEQSAIRGGEKRSYKADYCVPAQLVTPLMLRWLLDHLTIRRFDYREPSLHEIFVRTVEERDAARETVGAN